MANERINQEFDFKLERLGVNNSGNNMRLYDDFQRGYFPGVPHRGAFGIHFLYLL